MTDQQRGLLKDFWGPGMSAEPGERAVVPELAPAPSDWSLIKWRYSAFLNPDLLARMRSAGRDQLILSRRVRTRRRAGQRRWRRSATTSSRSWSPTPLGDFTEADHRHTLAYAALCCAMVVLTEDVLR